MGFHKETIAVRSSLKATRQAAHHKIIERINNGESLQQIADDFGLSVSAIKQIWNRAKN
jgi:uncharacterized protein (DUF433 family)